MSSHVALVEAPTHLWHLREQGDPSTLCGEDATGWPFVLQDWRMQGGVTCPDCVFELSRFQFVATATANGQSSRPEGAYLRLLAYPDEMPKKQTWPIRLRLRLLRNKEGRWNAWVRNTTAWMERTFTKQTTTQEKLPPPKDAEPLHEEREPPKE